MSIRCCCCDKPLVGSEYIGEDYCEECQTYVRQVFDKEMYELDKTTKPSKEFDVTWTREEV